VAYDMEGQVHVAVAEMVTEMVVKEEKEEQEGHWGFASPSYLNIGHTQASNVVDLRP